MHLRILMVLLLLPLAGCLGAGPTEDVSTPRSCDPGPLDPEGVFLVDPAHDPIAGLVDRDPWSFGPTNVRTCSLPAIGWSALSEDGVPYGYIGEIDMRGDLDLGAVAVLGNGERPMVVLLDISDRAAPEVLARIPSSGTYLVDVKFSDDGKVLYVASQNVPAPGELVDLPELSAPTGFTVYDLADPSAPRHMGTVVDPQVGCHMLDPVQVSATEDAVYCVSQHVRTYFIERGGPAIVQTGAVDLLPQRDGLPVVGSPPAVGDPTGELGSGPHDMTVHHEGEGFGDGASYVVASHWDQGVVVWDVSRPLLPEYLGAWAGQDAVHYDGNVHTAMMFDTAEGRYILASPEMTYPGVVPSLWLLDAEDLTDLRLVAEWYHPGQHTTDGDGTGSPLLLTLHQWQVAPTGPDVDASDVRVHLTYNHAGVWVLDLGRILEGDLQGAVLGFNLARTPLDPDTSVSNAVLSTWDVNVVDGHIYGSDRATGLWVFHYEEDPLGDPALTGFA